MEFLLDKLLSGLARVTSRFAVWYRWPFPVSIAIVLGHRVNMRRANLTDTEVAPPTVMPPPGFDFQNARTADGSYNDMSKPWMGMAGTRFGRNMPLASTFGETDTLFEPSPRLVSNRLLARRDFVPVPHLNVLAAAWIQFMVHDWLSHGKSDVSVMHDVPLPEGDDWAFGKMTVPRTFPDVTGGAPDGRPAAYHNTETHWWDGSQIYGSSLQRQIEVRSDPSSGQVLANGKLYLDANGMLPIDVNAKWPNQELAGVNGNWWIGLSVLHTLFAREHNSIVDRIAIDNPGKDGEWLFQKARLVLSALLAKIHTVEWTPALMNSPDGRAAMRGNFWGLRGERVSKVFGREGMGEILSGIPGSNVNHHAAPYAMTEEFAASYRLHSLLPDAFSFSTHEAGQILHECDLLGASSGGVRDVYGKASYEDVLYSLATAHPGALVLHNFPQTLRHLNKKPEEGIMVDLATIDILRDRERGIPRYCEFRRLINAPVPKNFDELTNDPAWRRELQEVYGTVDKVDLLVGTLAESNAKNGSPPGFGFSDTVFRIFILMASRRLKSDRFFCEDFRPEVYTRAGFAWVQENTFLTVVARHCPQLGRHFADVRNGFFPWAKAER
ncbi:peroxidase family protein [Rhizobium sp. BK251]|uniref:peroxidase family protein n=1 Tax=Rhizobium sp. BK251 TaxID=2512125 RepID=UPI0010475D7E|nr:peroxidase family protein [Rhizobium sp. BK251]TCL75688.1 heme peroxidase [Rhizobium sp. BK251]